MAQDKPATHMPTNLKLLSCLDSPELGELRRQELGIPRSTAAGLGWKAIQAIEEGYYLTSKDQRVDLQVHLAHARANKRSIAPDDLLPTHGLGMHPETRVQVTNETTLGASRRLIDDGLKPLALNFANGVRPGGGFLNGARAQEEVLCRSSALYGTLVNDDMYKYHDGRRRPDSSDWAIYSPDVPVFRADDGTPLDRPWLLSFITAAAPYAPVIGQPESGDLLQRRIQRVLAVSAALGYQALVLGAWGCGAFGNDAWRTATDFRDALENQFCNCFSDIVFAIADWSSDRRFLGPFRDVFSA